MRRRGRAARLDRRELRKLDKELSKIGGFGEPTKPPHVAKDFLGAVVTVAIIGALLLQATDVMASRCRTEPTPHTGPRSCSGVAAVAHHAAGAVTLSVAACAALALAAFIWYIFWGYKTHRRPAEGHDTSGP
jgi:hypothetical protein